MCRHAAIFAVALILASPAWAQTRDPASLVRQGRALAQAGQFAEAEALYRQALKAEPRQLDCLMALGAVLDMQGQYAEARTHFETAAEVARVGQPRASALWARAISLAFERRAAEAQPIIERVRAQQKADGDRQGAAASARLLGRIYLESGDVVNGRQWYELGYEESRPADTATDAEKLLWEMRSLHAQARLAAREGRLDLARKHLADFESMMRRRGKPEDDNNIHRFVAGYVAYYGKDYDRAIAELSKGNLGDAFIVQMLGAAYERKGDIESAKRYYQRTLDITAHNIQTALGRPEAKARLAALR